MFISTRTQLWVLPDHVAVAEAINYLQFCLEFALERPVTLTDVVVETFTAWFNEVDPLDECFSITMSPDVVDETCFTMVIAKPPYVRKELRLAKHR